MTRDGKSILLEGSEPHPPRVKGTVNSFVDKYEEFNYSEDRGCIPVNVNRDIDFDLYYSWCTFVSNHLDGVDWDFVHNGEYSDEFRAIVRDYISSNEEILERLKEISYWCKDGIILFNVKAAEEQGGIDELLEKYEMREIAEASYSGHQYLNEDGEGVSPGETDIGQSAVGVFD